MHNKNLRNLYILLIALIFIFIIYARFDSFYPLHVVEARQLTLSDRINSGNFVGALAHLQPVFTVLLFVINLAIPLLTNYYLIPALIFLIFAVFFWKYFDDKRFSYILALLYCTLPSTQGLLGILYGVPMLLGLGLFLVGICILDKKLFSKQQLLSFSILLLVISFVTPYYAILLGLVGVIRLRSTKLLIFGGVIGSILFIISYTTNYYFTDSLLLFGNTTSFSMNIWEGLTLLSPIVLIFSLIGAVKYIRKNKISTLSIVFYLVLFDLLIFYIFGKSVAVSPERLWYLVFIELFIFSSFGIVAAIEHINKKLSRKKTFNKLRFISHFKTSIYFIIILVIAIFAILSLWVYDDKPHHTYTILNQTLQAQLVEFSKYEPGLTVAPLLVDNVLELISKKESFIITAWKSTDYSVYREFLLGNCSVRTKIAKEKNIAYYFSYENYTCSGFNKIISARNRSEFNFYSLNFTK